MTITEEREPAPELATLVLSVPPERIGELKALAAWKVAVARGNAADDESKKRPVQAAYWRKEEAFWKSIREQLNQ
jgi:hypothetical protein